MPTRILDANDQERLGNRLVGMVDWNVVGLVTDADDPVAAEGGDLVAIGDLADDLTIDLPAAPDDGAQIAVYLAGDPDGNSVTIDPGGNLINGDANLALDTQYQFVVLAFNGDNVWGIASLGSAGGGVQSVFAATGTVLPNAEVDGDDLDLGPGNLNVQQLVVADGVGITGDTALGAPAHATFLTFLLVAAPDDSDISSSTFVFWFDATNGAGVLHIKAKTADGTVVGAAIPLA